MDENVFRVRSLRGAAVLGLALGTLAGCAFEPYPPLPELPPEPAGAELLVLPEPAPVVEPLAEASPDGIEQPVRTKPKGRGRKLTIRLKSQRFVYTEGGEVVLTGEVSSGSREHPTPKGRFRVLSKDKNKRSQSYTNYFNWPTPMPYALQFYGPYYVHEGWLPGHADSHGCVRLRYEDAKFLFERMRVGDPIAVVN